MNNSDEYPKKNSRNILLPSIVIPDGENWANNELEGVRQIAHKIEISQHFDFRKIEFIKEMTRKFSIQKNSRQEAVSNCYYY